MRVVLLGLGAGLTLIFVALLARDLVPPRGLTIAAGPEGGGYAGIAERYRRILARDRLRLEILATAGSVDNAERLASGEADIALLQGGIEAPEGMESLAAVFVEPLFAFARRGDPIVHNPGQWSGIRLATGGPGSGTAAAFESLLAAADLPADFAERVPTGGADAVAALREGKVDGALFVAPLSAPYIQDLLRDPEAELVQMRFVDAISRRLPQSRVVTLPAGSVSLEPTVPADDIRLLAMIARLVSREDLHPALTDRIIEAAREVHSGRDALTEEGRYPTTRGLTPPIDAHARNLLESGTSPLQQYLPYWIVAQINRVALLALPILFLLVPALRAAPGVYSWQMRRRVFRHYQTIRDIDEQARGESDPAALAELERRLDALDREIARTPLPMLYRDSAYTARLHIDLVRRRIEERLGQT